MLALRRAAVAGLFYPAHREVLDNDIRSYLEQAPSSPLTSFPKALIVPHAGYIYSGQTAANAYVLLKPYAQKIHRVVLVGPAHRVPFKGIALSEADAFDTPLGPIELDVAAIASISHLKNIKISAAAHAAEHSLEVQLPFLKTLLGEFTLVPLLVGDAKSEEIAEVIERLWGGDETLIVISSDLSHFLPYEDANAIDQESINAIMQMQSLDSYHQACGALPINGLLLAAQRHHLRPHLIASCNSGDTAGDKNRVVGYASFAFTEEAQDA